MELGLVDRSQVSVVFLRRSPILAAPRACGRFSLFSQWRHSFIWEDTAIVLHMSPDCFSEYDSFICESSVCDVAKETEDDSRGE